MNALKDSLLSLIEASLDANYSEVRRAANKIAQEMNTEDADTAKQIKSLVRRKGVPLRSSGYMEKLPTDPKSKMDLVEETSWSVTPLFLNEGEKNIFETFSGDVANADKLIRHGLAGRFNLMLSGPPGTGKSLIAGHVAAKLNKPIYTVRLDAMVSSLLGDTAKNIRNVFEFSANKGGVLFLDEVDALAKLRDDKHEVGELKRVVNTLIQGLDSLDDKSIVIAATNHAGLLDPAIWRRFPYSIQFSHPDIDLRHVMWGFFLYSDNGDSQILKGLATISEGLTGADIENISHAARRRSVLEDKEINLPRVVEAVIGSSSSQIMIPMKGELESQKKKALSIELYSKYKISQADIGKLLSVSRQAVSNYLKGASNG
ncbi:MULTISPECIES: AAA family ATPase [unclassified Modicisalibacter]|uniref:AAA family ATPase n=1 Tax=unclassified Modicisalibacter TaxID=2679913 RepID=UPI001CCE0A1F|nr:MULTISPECIES: AAA family ATPase [unclassified Modicisalibacter]MBZ9558036.1 AAA family ATPase [Modicisalibacter sp. R2A 31.J]MBZ9573296.1 AAA family ATPase [Modicisalibacter sp. MOD 31.J]